MDIVARPLPAGTRQVNKSAFALLFAEVFQYCQQKVNDAHDLEERLKDIGHSVGWRMLNLIVARERPKKRDTTPVGILQFITSTCWKTFYDRETKSLQRSTANENEFFIHEDDPVPSQYISMPRELQGRLNCASFNAGLIRGILHAAQFSASVRAVFLNSEDSTATTVYVVKFFDKSQS